MHVVWPCVWSGTFSGHQVHQAHGILNSLLYSIRPNLISFLNILNSQLYSIRPNLISFLLFSNKFSSVAKLLATTVCGSKTVIYLVTEGVQKHFIFKCKILCRTKKVFTLNCSFDIAQFDVVLIDVAQWHHVSCWWHYFCRFKGLFSLHPWNGTFFVSFIGFFASLRFKHKKKKINKTNKEYSISCL